MANSQPDITAVLNLHREGLLAHSSLRSMADSAKIAAGAGLTMEMLVVADRPDGATSEFLDTAKRFGARIVPTNLGDLGAARNAGIAAANGKCVAFLDGDDLWSGNWLRDAHAAATVRGPSTILHPEANLYFGEEVAPYWMMHRDGDTAGGDWINLGLRNHWTSLSFAARSVYEQVPYPHNDLGSGFGYEDWSWNARTISEGFDHWVVPGTVHMIRVHPRSLVRQTASLQALMTPSDLFRRRLEST